MHKKLISLIEQTETPITKTDIIDAFKRLGIHSKSALEVHASLSSLGYVVNKAYDVIDALLEVVTEGVIIMPAHTPELTNPRDWSNPPVPLNYIDVIEKHRKPFNPKVFIPERIGEIAKTFMAYPGVQRTLHPEVSLFVYNQTNDPSWLDHSFDMRDLIHPLHKLQESKGKILFIGTDFSTCTSIHLTEYLCQFSTLSSYDYEIEVEGEIIKKTITTKYFDDDDLNFKAISETYIKKYQNTDDFLQTTCGLATLSLIDAKKLFDIAKAYHLSYQRNHS